MRLDKAQALVNSIFDTHVQLVEGASREAVDNARQDILLLVEDIMKQCLGGIDLDGALSDAEQMTRRDE